MHVLIAAVLFAQAAGVPPQPTCYGTPSTQHPGYTTQAGWALPPIDDRELGVEYLCRGSEALIVLQSVLSRTPDGMPVWKVLAERRFKLAKGDGALTVAKCDVKGKEDPEVVPIGHYSDEGAAVITRAFRANRAKATFEVIAPAGIKCEVEGDD